MNYWLQALESALEEQGVFDLISEDKRKAIAKDLEFAHQMYGEATGESNIPNPLKAEVDRLALARERDANDANQREDVYKRCLAGHIGVDHRDIYIQDGRVKVTMLGKL